MVRKGRDVRHVAIGVVVALAQAERHTDGSPMDVRGSRAQIRLHVLLEGLAPLLAHTGRHAHVRGCRGCDRVGAVGGVRRQITLGREFDARVGYVSAEDERADGLRHVLGHLGYGGHLGHLGHLGHSVVIVDDNRRLVLYMWWIRF